MNWQMTFRILRSAAFVVCMIILTLNIENLAGRIGIQNLLADIIAPQNGKSPILKVVNSPFTGLAAAFFVGTFVGLWGDKLHKTYRLRRMKPVEKAENLQSRVYVGEMRLAANRFKEQGFLELSVRGYNGSGSPINITGISGHIAFQPDNNNSEDLVRLPTPVLLRDRSPSENLANGKEFLIVAQQFASSEITQAILDLIPKEGARFHLEDLKIEIDSEGVAATLNLWQGIFVRSDNWARSDRIHKLVVNELIGGAATH